MDYNVGNIEVEKNNNSDSKNCFAGYIKAMNASQKKSGKDDKNV